MAGIIAARYQNEDAAREHLERLLWPDGPQCPHCGLVGEAYKLNGETTRKGLYKCAGCREPFTVTVKTIFEDSKIPLHKWLLAIHLMCSSKKGISAHQLWRNLWGVDENGRQLGSYRTAWFMAHRIRWAMGQEPMAGMMKGIVELDETYVGGRRKFGPAKDAQGRSRKLGGPAPTEGKTPVVAVLQRGGNVHSFAVDRVTVANIKPVVQHVVAEGSHVMTDSASRLRFPAETYRHSIVNHTEKEYARREADGTVVTTNTVEGYFSLLKRGNYGVYHHWSQKFLGQYLREFDWRYNARKLSDDQRVAVALKCTEGKRLMLKQPKALGGSGK
jgi:transposase-like protein